MINIAALKQTIDLTKFQFEFPVIDKKGFVTVRTLKVKESPLIKKHNVDEKITQYNIPVPISMIETERVSTIRHAIGQMLDVIMMQRHCRSSVKITSYVPEKRVEAISFEVVNINGLQLSLTEIENDGTTFVVLDVVIK